MPGGTATATVATVAQTQPPQQQQQQQHEVAPTNASTQSDNDQVCTNHLLLRYNMSIEI